MMNKIGNVLAHYGQISMYWVRPWCRLVRGPQSPGHSPLDTLKAATIWSRPAGWSHGQGRDPANKFEWMGTHYGLETLMSGVLPW